MEKDYEKAPYYLLIHTDSYTGNFERELVAFCFGKLDEEQEGDFDKYSIPFWNNVVGQDINCLEDYEKINKPTAKTLDFETLALMEQASALIKCLEEDREIEDIDKCLEDRKNSFKKEFEDNDVRRLYDTYLCNTYQEVDDWEQETFYNICSFYKNQKYNCDTIYVQLNKPLNEHFEKIIIERIKKFFELNVLSMVKRYEYLCDYLEDYTFKVNEIKLLDLELVDENNNLIKKYV